MKKIITVLSVFAMFSALAGERAELLKNFEKEQNAAEKVWDEAMTQVELTAAAGNNWNTAEAQLFKAFDYKLRHTACAAERLKLIADFHNLSREVQKIHATDRKYMGSMAGMQIYSAIAYNMQQFTAVLMLDSEAEKRWKKR